MIVKQELCVAWDKNIVWDQVKNKYTKTSATERIVSPSMEHLLLNFLFLKQPE